MFGRKKAEIQQATKMPYFLVRHGQYNHETGRLTAEGETDAARASIELATVSRGIGREALILTSSYKRAMESTQIIGRELFSKPVASVRLALGGENPRGIKDLDDFLIKALTESGQELDPDQPLVVITHGPLMAMARGGGRLPGYGQVVEYVPGSWENKTFNPAIERSLEEMIAAEITNQQ